jgi:hypothetical protein
VTSPARLVPTASCRVAYDLVPWRGVTSTEIVIKSSDCIQLQQATLAQAMFL